MGIKEKILNMLNDNPKTTLRGDVLDMSEDISPEIITKVIQRLKEENKVSVIKKDGKTHYIITKLGKITADAIRRMEKKREENIIKSTEKYIIENKEETYLEKDAKQDIETYFNECLYSNIIASEKILSLDLAEIENFKPNLRDYAYLHPESFLKIAEEAIDNIDRASEKTLLIRIKDSNAKPSPLAFFNRSENALKLIVFEGMISTIENVRPYVNLSIWECKRCGLEIPKLTEIDGLLRKPYICECGNKQNFEPIKKYYEDRQYITISERELTPSPESVIAYVHSEMVNDIEPLKRKLLSGNVARFYAISEMINPQNNRQLKASVTMVARIISYEMVDETFDELIQSEDEIKKIKEFSEKKDVLSVFATAIGEKLIGKDYTIIKKALILQFFGGSKDVKDGRYGIIHLALIGDHGKGKTSFLKGAISFAPKSLYTSGVSSTGKGLMACLDVNEITKNKILRPGPYVRCNNGLICIDEVDKMKVEEIQYLGEALEERKFTFSKAGIYAVLDANASCLLSANPKNLRFDENSPIISQVMIPANIRDRFDLEFILRDIPDPVEDLEISMRVVYGGKKKKNTIDKNFVKKYIAYARANCNPKMPYDVAHYISVFYRDFRNPNNRQNGDPVSSTPRQSYSLRKLAEAAAKVRLSDTVCMEDANVAIKLYMACMKQIGYDDDTGKFDALALSHGMLKSDFDKKKRIIDTIKLLENKKTHVASLDKVVEDLKIYGMKVSAIIEHIDRLKKDGDIMMIGPDRVKAM